MPLGLVGLATELEKSNFLSSLNFWGKDLAEKTRKLQQFENETKLRKSTFW